MIELNFENFNFNSQDAKCIHQQIKFNFIFLVKF